MSTAAPEQEFELRIARLARQVEQLDSRLHRLEGHAAAAPVPTRRATPAPAAAPSPTPARTATPAPVAAKERGSLSDLVGGRVLAWLGGAATLLGLVLFLALAVAHGWIGVEARVLLAGAGSLALMGAGAWLREHRGRTEAAIVMVGTATAGLFATLIVASDAYGLIGVLPTVLGAMAVGGVAAALAIRWAGQAIGALGLVGALLSPILLGLSPEAATLAVLAVGCACATWVVVRQRWGWLAIATTLVCGVQWSAWVLAGESAGADLLVLGTFGALGLAAAVGVGSPGRTERASVATAILNAAWLAVVGRVALGSVGGDLWLVGVAGAYAGVGLAGHARISARLRHVLIAVAVTLVDVTLALSADGLVLSAAWGLAAVGFAGLTRRASRRHESETPADLGVGLHIALVLISAFVEAPPTALGTGPAQLVALASVAALAASCAACGRLVTSEPAHRRAWLDGLGLLALAYLTASALDGPALVVAWTVEGLALAELYRGHRDVVARCGALTFIGGAALHALVLEAPPTALVSGAANLGGAAVALGVLAAAGLRIGHGDLTPGRARDWWWPAAAGLILYLASIAIVTAFAPAAASGPTALLDLSVRQQGQVLLSALWSLAGLAALIVGLRRNLAPMRTAALALLLVAVAKVFLFDLATLTAGYRVVSFIVLGLLLLAGAFAYQRLRPPPSGFGDNAPTVSGH